MAKKLHADKLRERVVKGILPPAPASWRKIMAYNVCGDIGVIYDQSKNALIGLVDPCDVFDVNRFCISYLRKEVHDGIRLSADAGGRRTHRAGVRRTPIVDKLNIGRRK